MKRLIDVRRLAAVDLHGRRGTKRRRRLILAEFVLAAIGMPLLGIAILLAASSTPRFLLGAYLTGAGLNYVPLALQAISLSRAGKLGAELADVDTGAELRQYTAKQILIGIPLLLLILGTVQFAVRRRAPRSLARVRPGNPQLRRRRVLQQRSLARPEGPMTAVKPPGAGAESRPGRGRARPPI